MLRDPGDRAGDRGGDGRSEDVVVADVRKFVRDHAFEFVVVHQFHQSLRHGHRSVARIAAGGERVRRRLRNHIQLRHGQIGFGREALHHGVEPRRFLAADGLRAARRQRDLVREKIGAAVHQDGEDRARSSSRCEPPKAWPIKRSSSVRAVSRNAVLSVFMIGSQCCPRAIRRRPPSACLATETSSRRFSDPHPRAHLSPGFTSPSRIFSASGSWISRWIARFIGRAPYAGS